MQYRLLLFFLCCNFFVFSQNENDFKTDSLINKASELKKDNQFNNALKCYLQALKLATKGSSTSKKIHIELGQFYFDWGLYDKSIEYLKEEEPYSLNTEEHLKAIKLLALSFEKAKKYDLALNYFKDLSSKYKEFSRNKATTYVSISNIYKKIGQYNQALIYELDNLEIRKHIHDTVGMYVALNNIGSTYKNLNDYPKALEYLTQSYNLSKQVKEELQMGVTLMNIGLLYQLSSNQELAIKNLLMALNIFQNKQKKFEIAQVANSLGAIYFGMNELNKAVKYAQIALKTGKQANILESQSSSYKLLSRIYKSKNDLDESYKYLQKHTDIKDSLLYTKMIKDQEFAQKLLDIEIKETQIKDLLIDKELKDLQVKKLGLEKESKDKEWEILKKDKELLLILNREAQLNKEKELHLLTLREQTYKMEANAKQISLMHQQKVFEEQIKLNKLKEYGDKSKISELKLKNQQALLEKQVIYKNLLIVLIFLLPILGFLIFRIYAYRQNAINSKLMHRTLDLEQRMLRAQMNPHFIFNAMNSIQSFVTTNDSYSAEKYLARFSRLMRYILENSSKQYLCFEDELKMLRLYIELEQLRFDNKFTFEINVPADIDSEFIFIPPMLSQPYIENAIVHGLCNRIDNNGILKISYEIVDKLLICLIEDNGIGRANAELLKSQKTELHKSMGMQVTKERFDMLAKSNKVDFSTEVIDLLDDNLKPSGTKVKLVITFREEDEE
jgi:tetratricopeptide (TPR) repeat protein